MDPEKRRKIMIQQVLKLQELRESREQVNEGRRIQKKRVEPPVTLNRMTSQQFSKMEELQNNDCKLLYMQPTLDVGFKTFTEMMRANSNWLRTAPVLTPQMNNRNLQHRLEFNQAQTTKFAKVIERRAKKTVDEVSENVIQLQEIKHAPKIKLIQLKINHSEVEEEVEDIHAQITEPIPTIYKCFWFSLSISGWKPPIREGCTVTYLQNKCYVYGGIGNDLFRTFVTLQTNVWQWKDIGPGTMDTPLEGRFGHTATLYKNQIIIFGGEKKYNSAMKIRECYNDIRVYEPIQKTWLQLKGYGDILEGRRNHCAEVVGKFFIVYGGMNSYGKIVNEVSGLNLESLKWTNYLIESYSDECVSDARSVALFRGEVKMENPYFSYEYVKKKNRNPLKLQTEGIYIFGGRLQNGEASGDLRVICFGTKPLKCIKPKTKGIPPIARYAHSMNYYNNMIVIYGGRNDGVNQNILSDMFVLHIELMNWIQVQQFSGSYAKSNHCCVSIDSKLLLFGGYSNLNFSNAEIQLIELDQNKVVKMIKDNKQNKNRELVIESNDLIHNSNLKVFKTEYYNEAEDPDIKQKKIIENEIQKLSYSNFRSYLPLPTQSSSVLVQEYRLRRDQAKLDTIKLDSRRPSRRTYTEL